MILCLSSVLGILKGEAEIELLSKLIDDYLGVVENLIMKLLLKFFLEQFMRVLLLIDVIFHILKLYLFSLFSKFEKSMEKKE